LRQGGRRAARPFNWFLNHDALKNET
jgi:hypothetical protein